MIIEERVRSATTATAAMTGYASKKIADAEEEGIYMTTTKYKMMAGLAFSAALLAATATMPTARAEMNASGAEVVTNGPQVNPANSPGAWSARQNVRDSQRYEAAVRSNSRYRAGRVKKECGPINDPQLHASCVASFSE